MYKNAVNDDTDAYDGEAQRPWYRGVLSTMPRNTRRHSTDRFGTWPRAYRGTRGNSVTGPAELASDPIYELEGEGLNEQRSDSESETDSEYVPVSGQETGRQSGGAGPSTCASSRPRRMPDERLDELLKDMGLTK